MKKLVIDLLVTIFLGTAVSAQEAVYVRHSDLQAVESDGTSAWDVQPPFYVEGVLLNNPEDMLNPAPDFVSWDGGEGMYRMGGQWQVFIQSVDPDDVGGTACWMGQNYGNLPFKRGDEFSYSDSEWEAEIARLNRDPENNHKFRKGDLVRVVANRSLFYSGKRNINEAHNKEPEADFEIHLVTADYGLPEPEVITLSDLVEVDDGNPETHEDIFDQTRGTGGERYQSQLVRINGLQLVDASGWDGEAWSERRCMVTDDEGRYFPIHMPRYDVGPVPSGSFNATGILDQESGSGSDGTFGYLLFVTEVEYEERPQLDINERIVVSWPEFAWDYVFESAESLDVDDWAPVEEAPVVSDGKRIVILDATNGAAYFRLRRAD